VTEPVPHTLIHYTDEAGRDLFGDSKALGEGVSELRIDHGPGWRVYYGKKAGRIILLLAGSDKAAQKASIKTAQKRLTNWNQRSVQ
jgi:putative addiction module killer protein